MEEIILFIIRSVVVIAANGASKSAYGWAAPIGGAVLAIKWQAFTMISGTDPLHTCLRGIVGGLAGWLCMFALFIITIAPWRVYLSFKPISVILKKGNPEIDRASFGNEKQSIWLTIKNRSYLSKHIFAVKVIHADIKEPDRLPWFVATCQIEPRSEQDMELASWYIRNCASDSYFRILTPQGGYFARSSILELPIPASVIGLQISFEKQKSEFWLRIKVVGQKIQAEKLNAY